MHARAYITLEKANGGKGVAEGILQSLPPFFPM
jgi:hypothetical protein